MNAKPTNAMNLFYWKARILWIPQNHELVYWVQVLSGSIHSTCPSSRWMSLPELLPRGFLPVLQNHLSLPGGKSLLDFPWPDNLPILFKDLYLTLLRDLSNKAFFQVLVINDQPKVPEIGMLTSQNKELREVSSAIGSVAPRCRSEPAPVPSVHSIHPHWAGNIVPRALTTITSKNTLKGEKKRQNHQPPFLQFMTKEGEGTGDPLQYSCLENPVDRGFGKSQR